LIVIDVFLCDQSLGMKLTDDEIHTLLSDINVTYNGQLEMADYLQVSWT